jgi:CGNR zinc finger/Putative stress-induced transcription regulator
MSGQSTAAQRPVGHAPGELARLQAFVNTLDIKEATEELSSPETLTNWLHAAGLLDPPGPGAPTTDGAPTSWLGTYCRWNGSSGPAMTSTIPDSATTAHLETALELREALRGVLRSHVAPLPGDGAPGDGAPRDGAPGDGAPGDGADPLAGLRRISAGLPTRLEVTADGRIGLAAAGSGVPAALARILLIAADSATLGTWSRLKVCSADDCQWAFYDRSPTRSGCWCTMRLCGSRAKSRAYRRRAATPAR